MDSLTVTYPPDLRSLGLASFIKEVEETMIVESSQDSIQTRKQERVVTQYFVSNLEDLKIKLDHSVRSHIHEQTTSTEPNIFSASSAGMQGVLRGSNGTVLYIADGSRGFRQPSAGDTGWVKNLVVRDFLAAAGVGPGALDAPFDHKAQRRSLRRHGLVVQVSVAAVPVVAPSVEVPDLKCRSTSTTAICAAGAAFGSGSSARSCRSTTS